MMLVLAHKNAVNMLFAKHNSWMPLVASPYTFSESILLPKNILEKNNVNASRRPLPYQDA